MRLRAILLGLALVLPLAGCSHDPDQPIAGLPPADTVLAQLATALTNESFSGLPLVTTNVDPGAAWQFVLAEMDDYRPIVLTGTITYSRTPHADASLVYTWKFPSGQWIYEAPVALDYNDDRWQINWAPSLIHPDLDAQQRLVHTRQSGRRAGISGNGGQALIDESTVVRVGLDKTQTEESEWEGSARALAGLVGIDADAYAEKVLAYGPKAFVEAVVLRQNEVPDILAIPGARGIKDTALVGPYPGFMDSILGRIGEASAEEIEQSGGAIVIGDQVGKSGLQYVFDDQLRGTPGDQVYRQVAESPGQPTAADILYDKAPVNGQVLQVSFDLGLQQKAESIMAGVSQAAAAVLIRPSDGAVLAAASGAGSNGQRDATMNHYAPGSTFKIVTALALLRHGYTADTMVNCSASVTAGGQLITNYDGFPSRYLGQIPLMTAVAQSCNTAFVNQVDQLAAGDLAAAAASLGAGVDYDAGGLNYGTVPIPDSTAMKAMMEFGQGGVLMSPVAMAGVAASVAAGHTSIPWIVASKKPDLQGSPLTEWEGAELRRMMNHTVNTGLSGIMVSVAAGAKSGTAEYGTGSPLPTHGWMIAYTDHDLAVAVWVHDGGGTSTAGPIAKALLS